MYAIVYGCIVVHLGRTKEKVGEAIEGQIWINLTVPNISNFKVVALAYDLTDEVRGSNIEVFQLIRVLIETIHHCHLHSH